MKIAQVSEQWDADTEPQGKNPYSSARQLPVRPALKTHDILLCRDDGVHRYKGSIAHLAADCKSFL